MKTNERTRAWRLGAAATVGVLAGFLAGLFGVGGGILIVPGLVFLLRMEQRLAHGTSLAAIVPIAAAGVLGFALAGSVDWAVTVPLTLGAGVGAVVGTRVLQRLTTRALTLAFALLLLLTAARLFLADPEAVGRGAIDVALVAGLVGIGLLAGVVAGLFGVGGGVVLVPALVILFAFPDPMAKGTSLLVMLPTALVGTLRNLSYRNSDLRVAGVAGLSGVLSAYGGSQLAVRLDPRLSGILFAILLVAVAARLILTRISEPAAP